MGYKASNFAKAAVASPPSGTTGTAVTVASGKGALFATVTGADFSWGVFVNAAKEYEIVKISAHTAASDSFTIVRAQDGTTARTWLAGDYFYVANDIRAVMDQIMAVVENANVASLSGLTGVANGVVHFTAPGSMAVAAPAAARTMIGVPRHVFKNAITNGSPQIWQRGANFAAIANGTAIADRWRYGKVGTMVHAVSYDADVPSLAQAGRIVPGCIRYNLTTADTSIATGDLCTLYQYIEGYCWRNFWQQDLTLSFWVKASVTGTYCVALKSGGLDRSMVKEFAINASNTWEKKTIALPASPSAGTWDVTNGIGAMLAFTLAAGVTYHTTAGAWQIGNYYATSNQVNGVNSGATDFRVCEIQLEKGSQDTEFEIVAYEDELRQCERFLQVLGSGPDKAIPGFGYVTNSSSCAFTFPTRTAMRSLTPAVQISTFIGSLDIVIRSLGANVYPSGVTASYFSEAAVLGSLSGAAAILTTGAGCLFTTGTHASSLVVLSAEL